MSEREIEAAVGVKRVLKVVEREDTRREIGPGRLLVFQSLKRELAEPLPADVVPDPAELARVLKERVTDAEGFYVCPGGVAACLPGDESLKRLLSGGLLGVMHGRALEPAAAFGGLADALEGERFTVAEVETFAQDPAAAAVVRAGALAHLREWIARREDPQGFVAAVGKAGLVPGFDGKAVAAGVERLAEYVELQLRHGSIGDVFGAVERIKGVTP